MSGPRWRSPILLAALAALGLALWQPVIADPDTWGHVLFGRAFVHEPLPATNGYSFVAPDHPWITHEWGFQALMGLAWEAAGGRGLVALKAACVVLLLLVLAPGIHRAGSAEASAFLLLAVLGLANIAMLVRPQLATLVLIGVVMRLLDAVLRGSSARWLLLLPPLFAAWANLHGGFVVGLGLVGLAGCLVALALIAPGRSAAPSSPRLLGQLALTLGACAAATVLTPSGPRLWEFLARSLAAPPRFVTEWHPLHRQLDNVHAVPFLLVLALAVALLAWRRPITLTLAGCAFAVFSVATFLSIRHLAVAAVAGSLALADAWPAALARWMAGPRGRGVLVGTRLVIALLGASLLGPALPALLDGPGWMRVPEMAFPEEAMTVARARGLRGNAVVLYDWGGYVLFRAWPDMRVDVDSRCDTAYEMAMLEQAVEATRSGEGGARWLQRTRPDLVLMPPAVIDEWRLRESPEWAVVHEDPVAVLLARR